MGSAENVLDLILFNTSTIATQHLKEAKDTHHANINYLTIKIKTIEAQLDSILFERPMTKAQTNYNNKLHNKLTDLNHMLFNTHNKRLYTNYPTINQFNIHNHLHYHIPQYSQYKIHNHLLLPIHINQP